jgi:aflatoxin B1 aldehyde reductase
MTRVPLIFGTMTLGEAGRNGVRESDLPRCREPGRCAVPRRAG